jgi:hypothetical protein
MVFPTVARGEIAHRGRLVTMRPELRGRRIESGILVELTGILGCSTSNIDRLSRWLR